MIAAGAGLARGRGAGGAGGPRTGGVGIPLAGGAGGLCAAKPRGRGGGGLGLFTDAFGEGCPCPLSPLYETLIYGLVFLGVFCSFF